MSTILIWTLFGITWLIQILLLGALSEVFKIFKEQASLLKKVKNFLERNKLYLND